MSMMIKDVAGEFDFGLYHVLVYSIYCMYYYTVRTSSSKTGVKKSSVNPTKVAVTMALIPDCAPASLLTADREKLPTTGYPKNNPLVILAIPNPTNSILESNS